VRARLTIFKMSHSNNRAHQKQQLSAFHPRPALPLALGLRAPRSIGEMKKLADAKNAKPAERDERFTERDIRNVAFIHRANIHDAFWRKICENKHQGREHKNEHFFSGKILFFINFRRFLPDRL
jgi:hypothetical protein